MVGVYCNWSRHGYACSCLETVQALKIRHIKLIQAFALRIRSITYSEAVIDGGQDSGVDGAPERKRCGWRLSGLCDGLKFCISDQVIAS
jgi:hypothetical protein